MSAGSRTSRLACAVTMLLLIGADSAVMGLVSASSSPWTPPDSGAARGSREAVAFRLLIAEASSGSALSQPVFKEELDRMIDRLKKTDAIGILAKLSLKSDGEKLWADLASYHAGATKATLDELEERYHLIVHKLTLSLEKKDAELARDIAVLRDRLWMQLQDSEAFASL